MKNGKKGFFLLLIAVTMFSGCREGPKETPTKGYLKCFVDESLYNVIKEEADVFIAQYPEVKIDLVPVKAREGIAAILNGETEMFISSRSINNEEESFAKKIKSEMRAFRFCYDGVIVIANVSMDADEIGITMLRKLLIGKSEKYSVIIPEKNSGVYEFLKTETLSGEEPGGSRIVSSEKEVINSLKMDKRAIGLIGLNALKERDGIKVLKIGSEEININGSSYFEPHPGYLVNGAYPLVRTTFILLNEVGLGTASGFATFLTSTDGQKIVLKNNLGPATVPVKLK